MQEALKVIIDIQELDMKMIRLMKLKQEKQKELAQIGSLREELKQQMLDKQQEIKGLHEVIQQQETKLQEIGAKMKRLEAQQSNVKKADEFNALTMECTAAEREKIALEQKMSDLVDKKVAEEELLETIKHSIQSSEESGSAVEKEIASGISLINEEGRELKTSRDQLIKQADTDLFRVYERLLKNKKDRVVVPIENRTCSGCHIVLTAQHENLVRKGEGLIFCEHCSIIHYWPELHVSEEEMGGKRRRRRKTTA